GSRGAADRPDAARARARLRAGLVQIRDPPPARAIHPERVSEGRVLGSRRRAAAAISGARASRARLAGRLSAGLVATEAQRHRERGAGSTGVATRRKPPESDGSANGSRNDSFADPSDPVA